MNNINIEGLSNRQTFYSIILFMMHFIRILVSVILLLNLLDALPVSVSNETSSTQNPLGSTSGYYPRSTSYPSSGSNDLTGGQIALIVIGVILFCCCCGGGTAYKTGHWETVRVWVSD